MPEGFNMDDLLDEVFAKQGEEHTIQTETVGLLEDQIDEMEAMLDQLYALYNDVQAGKLSPLALKYLMGVK
jgi:hypothetical protein